MLIYFLWLMVPDSTAESETLWHCVQVVLPADGADVVRPDDELRRPRHLPQVRSRLEVVG